MNKKKLSLLLIFLLGFFLSLQASITQDLKLRFFEGLREGTAEPTRFVTSSYLQSTVTANIESKFLLAEEQEQIKKVFNLKDVRLITEADLRWDSKDPEKIFHIFRLDSKEYLVLITPPDQARKHQFKVEVFEQSEKGKSSLLDTEIILPKNNIAVFGFENVQGKPYFLSFHIPKVIYGGVVGGVLGVVEEKEAEDIAKRAVKAVGEIKPPKLIKKVEPVYPEEARKLGVEGVVILEAITYENGDVVRLKVLRSKDPLLSQAAIDAVNRWKYEPFYLKGRPTPIIFTVTVIFKLKERETKDFDTGAVKVGEEIKTPKLLKKVEPIYPEEARKAGVEGIVLFRVRVNDKGDVERIFVLKSESSMLNKAAKDAIKQWKYEPFFHKGKPTSIVFTVTVRFKLNGEKYPKKDYSLL